MRSARCLAGLAVPLLAGFAAPAAASFHFMQIEQVVGGVCGDTAQQAIQLRMRSGGQNLVNGTRLIAYDAAGANPVVLLTLPSNVAGSSAGSRILLATSAFAAEQGVSADFTLANPIPDAYHAAGRLVFEAFGTVYWSLSWGGAGYTGATTGATDNDADGDFGPSFPDPLPADDVQALRFAGTAGALSTNNAADYAVVTPVTVTDNAGAAVLVDPPCPIFVDGFESGDTTAWTSAVP